MTSLGQLAYEAFWKGGPCYHTWDEMPPEIQARWERAGAAAMQPAGANDAAGLSSMADKDWEIESRLAWARMEEARHDRDVWKERAERAEAERDHWKANHDNQVAAVFEAAGMQFGINDPWPMVAAWMKGELL